MEHSFEDVYRKYRQKVEIASRKYSRMSGVPVTEFVSHFNENMWDSYRRYDPTKGCSLDTWILKRLRQKAIDIMKCGEGHYYNRVFATLDAPPPGQRDNPEDAPTSTADMIKDERVNIEDDFLKKKEADKRCQLIDFLLESPKIQSDSTMTAIIEEYRNDDSQCKSINAIAKSLGLHHEVVKRKLRSLAKRYDANRFGDYHEYLAV